MQRHLIPPALVLLLSLGCTPAPMVDAGADDAGDAPADAGDETPDAGAGEPDAGPAPSDSGPDPIDSGDPLDDAGSQPIDAGDGWDASADDDAGPHGADGGEPDGGEDDSGVVDGDLDGYPANEDCDDNNGLVNPGADEVCDPQDFDEDCDGQADDADSSLSGGTTYYADTDGDGHGDADVTSYGCEPPDGFVEIPGDCVDGDSDIYPGAFDPPDDGIDTDCDGTP